MPRKSKWTWAGAAAKGVIAGAAGWAKSRLGGGVKKAVAQKTKTRARAVVRRKMTSASGLVKGAGSFSKWFPMAGRNTLPRRVLSSISGKNQYIFNMAQRLTSADGRQNATSVIYYDQLPLRNMFNSIATPAGNPTRRILLKSSYHEYTFTNASNTVAYLTIYDVRYKRDLEVAADPSVYTPEIAWNSGEIQEGNALGCTLVGSYPTRVGRFNDYYSIANKTTHLLMPGEVHKHKVLLRPNRFISRNLVDEKNYYRGLTSATMFVAQGIPVDNGGATLLDGKDGSGNDILGSAGNINAVGVITPTVNTFHDVASVVTTSPTAINCVYSARYQFHWLDDIDSDITVTNALQTGVGGLDVMEFTGIPYTVGNT